MKDFGFYSHGMFILDAVPKDAMQTGKSLEEAIRDMNDYSGKSFFVQRMKCNTPDELLMSLDQIYSSVYTEKEIPIIHLEGHSSREGVEFQNGKYLQRWEEMFQKMRAINILTCNNLFFSSGSCNSAYSYVHETSIDKACPVLGMLAPEKEVTSGEVKDGFLTFYKCLIDGGNVNQALDQFYKYVDSKKFALIFSNQLFEKAMYKYLTEKCMGKGLRTRKETLLTKALSKGYENKKYLRKKIKQSLKAPQAKYLDQTYRTFLMIDQCHDNQSRFPFNAKTFEIQVRNGAITMKL